MERWSVCFRGTLDCETSLDSRVMDERRSLRGALERRKLDALDDLVRAGKEALVRAVSMERATGLVDGVEPAIEAALLSPDHLAAVKLALKIKRLPLTPEDVRLREDMSKPITERLASGLSDTPLDVYLSAYRRSCEFSEETLRVTRFLILNRRTFRIRSELGLNDALQVEEFAKLCGDEQALRSLFVFTCADRADWENRLQVPARWWSIDELYAKTMRWFRPETDPEGLNTSATPGSRPGNSRSWRISGRTFSPGSIGRTR